MYLSRLRFGESTKCRAARFSATKLHGIIERCFEGERERVLWRIDKLGGREYILIMSENLPDLSVAAKQICDDGEIIEEIKSYDKMLEKVKNGEVFRFRLRANPVRKTRDKSGEKERNITSAILSPNGSGENTPSQRKWLLDRAESLGFSATEDTFQIVRTEWININKQNNRPFRFKAAEFEGILTVTDADLFKHTLEFGIGREKAYGCGMMTVVKL
jgi:CRISPR system Cascade subunit CasE